MSLYIAKFKILKDFTEEELKKLDKKFEAITRNIAKDFKCLAEATLRAKECCNEPKTIKKTKKIS